MDDDDKLVDLSARRHAQKQIDRKRRVQSWMPSYTVWVWGLLLAVAVVSYLAVGRSERFVQGGMIAGTEQPAGIAECGLIRKTCLVDADTGWQDGTKWRFEGVDAPEMDDKAECAAEREKAAKALGRLKSLMTEGYAISDSGRKDKFGRSLVKVALLDGRDAGNLLISEGLARAWPNTGNVWCDR